MARAVGLHPDLVACIELTSFGVWVKHPLVISPLVPSAQGAELLNASLRAKRADVESAARAGKWANVVWLHERPWRPDVLVGRVPGDADGFWELAAHVWVDTEFPHLREALWRELFARPGVKLMMSREELDVLSSLPQRVNIYRGAVRRKGESGLSWTLDRGRAAWFSRRFALDGEEPVVLEGRVNRAEIIAFLTGRNEDEVLVLPEAVQVVDVSSA